MIKTSEIFGGNVKFYKYGRSGVIYYTDDLDELYLLTQKGWKHSMCDKGFKVIPPCVTICDVVDCDKAEQYGNVVFNAAYFKFLKDLISKNKFKHYVDAIISEKSIFYKNFTYHISVGPILECEIIIEGSDNRVRSLKCDLLSRFMSEEEFDDIYKYHSLMIKNGGLVPKEKVIDKNLVEYFKQLAIVNSVVKKVNIPSLRRAVNAEILDDIKYDFLLFIPYGCYKFVNIFLNGKNYHKAMFREVHIGDIAGNHKIFDRNIKGKRILIIDSVYSGGTLDQMKRAVKANGGTPIVLGVNPKCLSVLKSLDYCMILDKIYKICDLNINSDLFQKKYVSTYSRGVL